MQTLDYIWNPTLSMWHDVELCLVYPSQVQHPRRYSWGLHLKKKKNLYKAWIQRRPGVDTETARRGYRDVLFLGLHFFLNLIQSVDTATARRGYIDGQAWIQRRLGHLTKYRTLSLLQHKLGVISIATELFPRKKKTLRRGNIHDFPWILPRFAVAKLITCTSVTI